MKRSGTHQEHVSNASPPCVNVQEYLDKARRLCYSMMVGIIRKPRRKAAFYIVDGEYSFAKLGDTIRSHKNRL